MGEETEQRCPDDGAPTKEGDVVFLLSAIDKLKAEKAYLETLVKGLTDGVNRATALIVALRAEKAETIEVLELYGHGDTVPFEDWEYPWWRSKGKPLLDKLKGES